MVMGSRMIAIGGISFAVFLAVAKSVSPSAVGEECSAASDNSVLLQKQAELKQVQEDDLFDEEEETLKEEQDQLLQEEGELSFDETRQLEDTGCPGGDKTVKWTCGDSPAELRCSSQPAGSRPIMIFVGSPIGTMGYWMNTILHRVDAVGVNLITWDPKQIASCVKHFKNPDNAKKFGGNSKQVILSGYSRGGIVSHVALESLMKEHQGPWGVMWFNGVTRGKTWKKGSYGEDTPQILILQGLLDKGFLDAAGKYIKTLKKSKIEYTYVECPKADHVTLKKDKGIILDAVENFVKKAHTSKCDDKPAPWMEKQGRTCSYDFDFWKLKNCGDTVCKSNSKWVKGKFCQDSCFRAGCGYTGDQCD